MTTLVNRAVKVRVSAGRNLSGGSARHVRVLHTAFVDKTSVVGDICVLNPGTPFEEATVLVEDLGTSSVVGTRRLVGPDALLRATVEFQEMAAFHLFPMEPVVGSDSYI